MEGLMKRLLDANDLVADARAALEATQEAKVVKAAEAMRDGIVEQLKEAAKAAGGVTATSYGKVGWQERRTVVYPVDVVRDLVPQIAPLAIVTVPAVEKVDRTTLERTVKAAIRTLAVPANTLERLLERAEVTTTQAWICQPQLPATQAAEPLPF